VSGARQSRGAGGRQRPTTRQLERALGRLPDVAGPNPAIVDRRPLAYHSTFPIELLVARDAAGSARSLVFKDLSRSGPEDPGWRVRAPFLHDPLREIACYRDVLSRLGLSTPRYLGSTVVPASGRHWLFLERLLGDPLWQMGDVEVWARAARWLAKLHGRFEGRVEQLPGRLIVHDRRYWSRWLARARRRLAREDSPRSHGELRWLLERAERAVDWLVEQPETLIHGDFHPSNVLVERRGAGTLIHPVDWEMAGIGPGILDLAALTSGRWEPQRRAAVLTAYRGALPRRCRPPDDGFRRSLQRCRLLLAVQWLGWSAGWDPPPEHAHDWLAAAFTLAGHCPAPIAADGGEPAP